MKAAGLLWREDKRVDSFKIWGLVKEHRLFVIWQNTMPNVKRGQTWKMNIAIGDTKPVYSDEIAELKGIAQDFLNTLLKDMIEDKDAIQP